MRFEQLIKGKLGARQVSLWTSKRATDSAKHFDTSIKRQFNPYGENEDIDFEIPFYKAPDVPEIGLESGYLAVTRYTLLNYD
jgi:hypothetical protein